MDDTAVKCFLAAAESGNFSSAAKELGISKQEVSRQIVKLEDEVGQKLFNRMDSKVHLNPGGIVYYSLFRRLLDQFYEVKAQVQDINVPEKEIRIGCMKVEGAGDFLSDIIQSFSEENENVNIVWEYHYPEELIPMLINKKLDMVIVFEELFTDNPNRSSLECVAVHQATMMLLASKNHRLVREGATMKDFLFEPCYLSQNLDETISFLKNRLYIGSELSFDLRIVQHQGIARAMVESGQGITICSDLCHWINNPDFVAYPVALASNVLCVWRRNDVDANILSLEKWIIQHIRKENQ